MTRLPVRATIEPKSGRVGLVTALSRRVRLKTLNASRRKSSRSLVPTTLNALAQRHVEVPEAGLPQRVALLRGGERAGGRRPERVAVEPDGARRVIPLRARRRTGRRSAPRTAGRCPGRRRRVVGRAHVNGAPDCAWKTPGDVPVAEHPPQRRHRAVERREPVAHLRHQHVRPIEIGDAVVAAVVVGVRAGCRRGRWRRPSLRENV